MRKHFSGTLLIAALSLLTSCASIAAPGPDVIQVSSYPPAAEVYLDGRLIGKTPTTVAVNRDSEGEFILKLPGYKTARLDREKVLNGWFFPGALTWILLWPGVPISMVVDLAAGNQGKYSTAPIHVVFERGSPTEIVDVNEGMRRSPAVTADVGEAGH